MKLKVCLAQKTCRQYYWVWIHIFADCAQSRGFIPRGGGWICIKLSCFGNSKQGGATQGGARGIQQGDGGHSTGPSIPMSTFISHAASSIRCLMSHTKFLWTNIINPSYLFDTIDIFTFEKVQKLSPNNKIMPLLQISSKFKPLQCCPLWLATRIWPGSRVNILRNFLST